jgi:hypothetical protein
MSKDGDQNRKAILARRARFMAAALTASSGCKETQPTVCLDVDMSRETPHGEDPWAEQRAKAKRVEEELARARGDAGTAQPALEDQIPEHRRREAEASREGVDPQRPLVCLTIRAVRPPEGKGATKPEPEKK